MSDEEVSKSQVETKLSGNRLIGVKQFLQIHPTLIKHTPQLIEYALLRPEEKLRSREYVHVSDRGNLASQDPKPPVDWKTIRTEEVEIPVEAVLLPGVLRQVRVHRPQKSIVKVEQQNIMPSW